jgi:hypothetical protein
VQRNRHQKENRNFTTKGTKSTKEENILLKFAALSLSDLRVLRDLRGENTFVKGGFDEYPIHKSSHGRGVGKF